MLTDLTSGALARARQRRSDLHRALQELEEALASPVPGRSASWRADLTRVLERLIHAFRAHVEETEGRDGLLAQIVTEAPRLANPVERMKEEHVSLSAELQRAKADAHAGVLSSGDVREELMGLCVKMARHRQAGSDLVYEAYTVDIGTGAD